MNLVNNSYQDDLEIDKNLIRGQREKVIAGFLNIGKKDGWYEREEGFSSTGWRFTRYMFASFYEASRDSLGDYRDLIASVNKAFFADFEEEVLHVTPRAAPDPSIYGWLHHCVTYMRGNLGCKKSENGPFFEVVVNSARIDDTQFCFPFRVYILLNKESAAARTKELKPMLCREQNVAYPVYYNSTIAKTIALFKEIYHSIYGREPGKEAMRMLEALYFLEKTKMKAQMIDNCWMKQNERLVLALLFIEIVAQRPELIHQEAWDLAEVLYKKWICFTKCQIEKMLDDGGVSRLLAKIVRQKLHPAEAA